MVGEQEPAQQPSAENNEFSLASGCQSTPEAAKSQGPCRRCRKGPVRACRGPCSWPHLLGALLLCAQGLPRLIADERKDT